MMLKALQFNLVRTYRGRVANNIRSVSKVVARSINNENATSSQGDSFKYCLTHVQRYDRENYLAALCIGDPLVRRSIIALRAFNAELALIRDATTNSDRAKVRFHFWSKLVEEILRRNNLPPEHNEASAEKDLAYYRHTPVAKELLDLFRLIEIDTDIKQSLTDLIGARISSKVLGYKPFDSMAELELYSSKSNGSIYQLSWRLALQLRNSPQTHCDALQSISKSLGIAHGLSNIIRGIPYNSTKNCCYIPQDILMSNNLTIRDLMTKQLDGSRIAPVVEQLAIRCQDLVDQASSNHKNIPSNMRQLFLPRVAITSYLKRLRKCNYNICDPSLGRRNELLPLSIWMASKFYWAPIL